MGQKKALMTASVASMIDLFNMDNIHILQKLGYEVHVATNFEFGNATSQERVDEFRHQLEREGIVSYQIPIPRSVGDIRHIIQSYRQMKQICMRQKFDLIHTQSPIGGVVARLAAKGLRKRGMTVIYTAHGFHFYDGAPKKNWLLFYPIEKYFSRYTDILITINQEDCRRAKKFHAKEAVYVPGIGVDTRYFAEGTSDRKNVRDGLGVGDKDYLLVSVGQLSKRKNQETVIRAVAHLNDKKVKYLIVGLGELEGEDRSLAERLGVGENIIFAGYRRDVRELLHAADCFVSPSLQEGLPVALMEAMAAGVPVICSRIRGNTDLITDGIEGKLIGAMDVKGYAEAIAKYKKNPGHADACRRRALEKVREFSKENVHRRMEEIYRGACR